MTVAEKINFKFTDKNLKEAKKIIAKYPGGRQASAVIPLLHLAQKQNENYLTLEAMNYVAEMISMPPIKVYEVAHFYTMFNHKPVGKYHLQLCTTTPCCLQNLQPLIDTIKEKVGIQAGEVSKDGLFSFKEVECLGACVNAPVLQINDDYVEDLTEKDLKNILDKLKKGEKINIGPCNGRHSSEPKKEV